MQRWQRKQQITEGNAMELQSALEAKDAQMLKLTQAMSSMLSRVEILRIP